MSTAEMIYERAKRLPTDLQSEVLDFLDFLSTKSTDAEGSRWAEFSTSQLSSHYAPEDSVYDEE